MSLTRLRVTARARWWITFVLIAAVAGIWTLTTPLFGAPDEPAHVIRAAAIARGELTGSTREGEPDFVRYVSVPAIFGSPTIPFAPDPNLTTVCFAFDRNATPDCLSFSGSNAEKSVATHVGTYPPLYYGIAGASSLGLASVSGVLLMRAATMLACAALVAWAYWSARRMPNPRAALLGLVIAVTPMTLFLFGSVNPNALEIAAGIAVWAAGGVLALEASSRIDRRLVAVTGVSASVLVLARSLSPLWLALIAVTLAVFAPAGGLRRLARDPMCRIWAAVVGVATVVQLAWIGAFDAVDSLGGEGVDASASESVRSSLGKSGDNYEQMIGVFGWLDTPAPFLTVVVWTGMLGALIILAMVVRRRRQRIALLGLIGAAALVPVVLETAKAADVGFVWQGRYTMPLAVGVPVLAGLMLASERPGSVSLDRTRLYLGAMAALFAAHLAAFVQHLRRNMVGYDGPIQFWSDPDWSPLLPAWVLVPAYALALAALLWWTLGPASVQRPVLAPERS